ncbi:hypothetical protein C6P64_13625 [Malikia granosa]|uniref:Uncharacterized protein n=1 Tax=Malikia granosa TaxID=263067 RepID=A0A2S9K2J3_9BURK|nr:hypothetical protein C6P64_13625 [Malikia granosa]
MHRSAVWVAGWPLQHLFQERYQCRQGLSVHGIAVRQWAGFLNGYPARLPGLVAIIVAEIRDIPVLGLQGADGEQSLAVHVACEGNVVFQYQHAAATCLPGFAQDSQVAQEAAAHPSIWKASRLLRSQCVEETHA